MWEHHNDKCCFTGHRVISREKSKELEYQLTKVLTGMVEEGMTYFITGGALGFDTLAAQVVLRLKEEFAHIYLILALPCHEQELGWSETDRKLYQSILERADRVFYVQGTYSKTCMAERNRYMVDHADVCVAYCTHAGGGTGYTVRYANSKGVPVINLK